MSLPSISCSSRNVLERDIAIHADIERQPEFALCYDVRRISLVPPAIRIADCPDPLSARTARMRLAATSEPPDGSENSRWPAARGALSK
ncbi:hypothetical protein [Bradyrhizobium neotropicale]|uniref:hypothetical protein n=1 Tax=Bradyrhizobium neotropicale TaxID=1497615 RepID=UPI001AD638DC|nr:hypothetical protein [Bradyrhizobium neotropicale]MBO4225287.1 hypothetical protein [Bradyrhizobium neotropicale]